MAYLYPNGIADGGDERIAEDFKLLLAADDCRQGTEGRSDLFFDLQGQLWQIYNQSSMHLTLQYRPPWARNRLSTSIEQPSDWDTIFRKWLWEGFDELERVSVGKPEFCESQAMLALLIRLAAYLWDLVHKGDIEPDLASAEALGAIARRFACVCERLRVSDANSEEILRDIKTQVPGYLMALDLN